VERPRFKYKKVSDKGSGCCLAAAANYSHPACTRRNGLFTEREYDKHVLRRDRRILGKRSD
jgi:hypothetical protein